jgi:hypothetical protein
MEILTFKSSYEESGYFDKDEQGWCAYYVEISCEDGVNVTMRRYFNANGYIHEDVTYFGEIQNIDNEIVSILLNTGRTVRYSLSNRRLVDK